MKVLASMLQRRPLLDSRDTSQLLKTRRSLISEEKFIIDMRHNQRLLEAIQFTSPSLFNAINSFTAGTLDNQAVSRLYLSLYLYVNRMTFRSVPFGYSASVAMVTDDTASMKSDERKDVTVSLDWAKKFSKMTTLFPGNLRVLKFYFTKNWRKCGNRYEYFDGDGVIYTQEAKIHDAIYSNPCIDAGLSYTELLKIWPTQISTQKNIKMLIELGLVTSNIFPIAANGDILSSLITGFEGISRHTDNTKALYMRLLGLQTDIRNYQNLKLGMGEKLLHKILNNMREMVQNAHYLSIEYSSGDILKTSEARISEAKKAGEYLIRLSSAITEKNDLSDYTDQFVEHFGTEQAVPLMTVLSEKDGIGIPDTYIGHKKSIDDPGIMRFYRNAILGRIPDSEGYVHLRDNDIQKFGQKDSLLTASTKILNIDIGFEFSDSTTQLIPNSVTNSAHAAWGRFEQLIKSNSSVWSQFVNSDNCYSIIDETRDNETLELQNVKSALLQNITSGIQTSGRNVNLNSCLVRYDLKHHCLKLVDDSNRDIMAVRTNMLAPELLSSAFRMICDLSPMIDTSTIRLMSVLTSKRQEHQPGIKYNNVILSAERWNFKVGTRYSSGKSIDALIDKVQKTVRGRFVKIYTGDNFIVCDMHDKEMLAKVIKRIQTENYISIEALPWSPLSANALYSQILTFLSKDFDNPSKVISPVFAGIQEHESPQLPLHSNWVYFQLHVNHIDQDNVIRKCFEYLTNAKYASKLNGFFIRYYEKNDEVRFRINLEKLNTNEQDQTVLEAINYVNSLCLNGIVSSYELTPYQPEMERYGGKDGIRNAEKIFASESKFIAYNLEKTLTWKAIWATILVQLQFEAFCHWNSSMSKIEALRFLAKQKTNKDVYEPLLNLLRGSKDENYSTNTTFLSEYSRYLSDFYDGIDSEKIDGIQAIDISSSLVHMTCNRFSGDFRFEILVRDLLRREVEYEKYN